MVHMVFSINTKKPQKAKEKNKNFIKNVAVSQGRN